MWMEQKTRKARLNITAGLKSVIKDEWHACVSSSLVLATITLFLAIPSFLPLTLQWTGEQAN